MDSDFIYQKDYPGGFIVTGIDRNHKRFKKTFGQSGFYFAFGINLYRGHVWGINKEGKRKMLKSVYN